MRGSGFEVRARESREARVKGTNVFSLSLFYVVNYVIKYLVALISERVLGGFLFRIALDATKPIKESISVLNEDLARKSGKFPST